MTSLKTQLIVTIITRKVRLYRLHEHYWPSCCKFNWNAPFLQLKVVSLLVRPQFKVTYGSLKVGDK